MVHQYTKDIVVKIILEATGFACLLLDLVYEKGYTRIVRNHFLRGYKGSLVSLNL